MKQVAGADPQSGEAVRLMIENLEAAAAALRSDAPDALNIAARRMIAGHLATGLAWRKYVAGSPSYDVLKQVSTAFADDAQPLLGELSRRLAAQAPLALSRGNTGYVLPCAACGGNAVTFTVKGDTLLLDGLSSDSPLECHGEAARKLSALLAEGDARVVMEFLRGSVPGCDSYCPDCDRLYCQEHYSVEMEWSGSWLTAVHATCPLGHAREIA